LQEAGLIGDPPPCDIGPYLTKLVVAAGDRIKLGGDILYFDEFFLHDDDIVEPTSDAFRKRIVDAPIACQLLREFRGALDVVEPFDPPSLETALKAFVDVNHVAIGDVVHPVRVAITGKLTGIGLYDALAILGRESCRRRIDRAVDLAECAIPPRSGDSP
jgi:glutamyl-tRNA synthetase